MKVFSNLAVSVDGKIADARRPTTALGTPLDRRTMNVLRAQCDVVVVGANTVRASPHAYVPKGVKRTPGARNPANAIITASGHLDPEWKIWNDPSVVRFVFTTERGFARALEASRDRAFVVKAGTDRVDLREVLRRLKGSGLRKVLVEGGGELMAEFLAARLLHEMHVTLTPWALGGRTNPTLIGGEGLEPWSRLTLEGVKRVKNELFLRYRVKGARRV